MTALRQLDSARRFRGFLAATAISSDGFIAETGSSFKAPQQHRTRPSPVQPLQQHWKPTKTWLYITFREGGRNMFSVLWRPLRISTGLSPVLTIGKPPFSEPQSLHCITSQMTSLSHESHSTSSSPLTLTTPSSQTTAKHDETKANRHQPKHLLSKFGVARQTAKGSSMYACHTASIFPAAVAC